jgi:glutamate transport system permease protein
VSEQTVLYDVQGPKARRRVLIGSVVGVLLLLALLAVAIVRLKANGQFASRLYTPFLEEPEIYERLLEGLQNTLKAAAYALVLASVLGVVLAFGRLSSVPFLRYPAIGIIELFRAIPLLLLILGLFLAYPILTGDRIDPLWALVVGLTVYNGAVIAEIIRAGIQSLPRGQSEAASSIGLGRGQTLRLVLLPQAVRIMLPALISQLVVLLKDTSLGFIIGFPELLRISSQVVQVLDNPLQLYVLVALIYILINLSLSRLASYLEGRQRRTMGGAALPTTQIESGMGQAAP